MSEQSLPAFSLTYNQTLPQPLWQRTSPQRYDNATVAYWNRPLAGTLGLSGMPIEQWRDIIAGLAPLGGVQPIAQAYAGHQFGHFTNLGDGRAHLLAELLTPSGVRYDLQLKGSGQTPYSRRGDGLATLGPMIKEILFSEALHALGIPTTRSLAVLQTHETVYRETQQPGAVLARVAQSHIRVGTFQFARAVDYNTQTPTLLPALLAYSIERHYLELRDSSTQALDFLREVAARQAFLIAQWQAAGFIHGVMNTDNMLVCGETIDFGPCAWLDAYDPQAVFSSIDRGGRYAYGNQPNIAQWNLARLSEALLPLVHPDEKQAQTLVQAVLASFAEQCAAHLKRLALSKLGFAPNLAQTPQMVELLGEWLHWLQASRSDYVQAHSELSDHPEAATVPSPQWRKAWLALAPEFALMRQCNPRVSPRNHAIQELLDLVMQDPERGLKELPLVLACLQSPFTADPHNPWYSKLTQPRPENVAPHVTFCGT